MSNTEITQAIKDLKDGLNSKFTPEQFKPRMEAKIKELESQLSGSKNKKSIVLQLDDLHQKRKREAEANAVPLKKSVPVAKASTKYAEDEDGYCDKVIAQAKERRAKAKARSQEPQKTEGTKNKEKIEKVVENVKERAKNDNISVSELKKLISETEELLNVLKSRLSKMK